MLRAVDIASHQAGINPASLDCDIVIVKVSGGASYENPYWMQWADEVLESGKLLGLYHYAMEYGIRNTARQEADYFLERVSGYKGRFVPILDWENDALSLPASWAREWLDDVNSALGSTPMFYAGASDLNSKDYSQVSMYPLWMASYLNRYIGSGWIADPANTWGTGSWDAMAMYQYTSTGHVRGYDGNLDLSVYYGTEADWRRLEGAMLSREAMVRYAVAIAEDDSHGYSWADRWDIDRDCASLMYDSAASAGFPVGRGPDKTRYTGTMIDDFTNAGFTLLKYAAVELRRGDILLRNPWSSENGHTEMYIGDNQLVGAHCSENGTAYGEPGDQTGNEISVGPLYGNWDYVLRPDDREVRMGEWLKGTSKGNTNKWWYRHVDGSCTKSDWEFIEGKWYYFDAEGWMVSGWVDWDGERYYCQPKTAKTGNDYGWMVTGARTIGGKRYYFEPNGIMFRNGFRRAASGKWYCFGKDGARIMDDKRITVSSKTGAIRIG